MLPGFKQHPRLSCLFCNKDGTIFSTRKRGIVGSLTRAGYLRVGKESAHRLIMECFQGPSVLHVNHINGDKADNRLLNLEYVTHKENILHAHKTGLVKKKPRGEKHPNAKYDDMQMLTAITLRDSGWALREIEECGYMKSITFQGAIYGKSWPYLQYLITPKKRGGPRKRNTEQVAAF